MVILVQWSAILLAICMTGSTFLAGVHLLERPRRAGSVLAQWFDGACVIFLLQWLFLPMALRKVRSNSRSGQLIC